MIRLRLHVESYMMGLRYQVTVYDEQDNPLAMGHGDTQARAIAMALRELANLIGA